MEVKEPEHAVYGEQPTAQTSSGRAPAQRRTHSLRHQLAWSGAAFIPVLLLAASLGAKRHEARAHAAVAPGTDAQPLTLSPDGQRILEVKVEPVQLTAPQGYLNATGTITLPPQDTVNVTPSVQGRVQEVCAQVGQNVRAGQVLATLRSVDAANAVNTLQQAENKLRLTRQTLERQDRLYQLGTPDVTAAAAALKSADEQLEAAKVSLGQQVSTADAALKAAQQRQGYANVALTQTVEQARIGGFTQKPAADAQTAVVQARTVLQQADADYAQARKELDRTRQLARLGIAADRDVVAAQNAYDKARSGVDGSRETLALAQETLDREKKALKSGLYANQQLEQARSNQRQADLDVVAAETALHLAQASGQSAVRQADLARAAAAKSLRLARAQILRDLQQARTDFQNAGLDLEAARGVLRIHGATGEGPDGTVVPIRSPISGVVLNRGVNPGQIVDTSTLTPWQMFTVGNYDRVWVEADIYDRDLHTVRPGEGVEVRVPSVPGRVFVGRVAYIVPNIGTSSHSFKVRTELPNPQHLLKNGQFADVRIALGQGAPALRIPAAAVQVEEDRDFVFVELAPGKYQRRSVRLGAERNGYYPVTGGLAPGDRVVTHGGLFIAAQKEDA